MTRRDAKTLGTHAPHIATEVRAETYHETHLSDETAPAARTARLEPTGEASAATALPSADPRPAANRLDHGKILVGVDGSECGRAALNWAVDEARRRGVELVVVAAWVPQGPMAGPMIAPGPDVWADTIQATRRMLDGQVESLQDAEGLTWRTELVAGPPYEALEERSGEVDLLVVGNHGRGTFRRAFLGSVSRHVCRHARCPVVVVPRPRAEAHG